MIQIPELLLIIFDYVISDDPCWGVSLMLVKREWRDIVYNCTCIKYLRLPIYSFLTSDSLESFLSKDIDQLVTQDLISLINTLVTQTIDSRYYATIIAKLNEYSKMSPTAWFILGTLYQKGLCGLTTDSAKAFSCWEEGAKLDDVYCLEKVIICLSLDNKCPENKSKIYDLLKKCIKLSKTCDSAFNILGAYYNQKNNIDKAIKYYQKAAELGNSFARTNWGFYMFSALQIKTKFVFYLLKSATFNGPPIAQSNLGYWYWEICNFEKAEKNFRKGYELGDISCLNILGHIFQAQNRDKEAFECFSIASEKGDLLSTFNLACCYLQGTGVEKNEEKWIELMNKHQQNLQKNNKEL